MKGTVVFGRREGGKRTRLWVLAVCLAIAAGAAGCPMGQLELPRTVGRTGGALIVSYNLQDYAPVPTAGASPVKSVTNRPDMEVSVVWQDAEGGDITAALERFAEGTVYRAVITLATKDPWRFSAEYELSYPAGTVASQSGDGRSVTARTVRVQYNRTAAPDPVSGGDRNLARYIPQPAAGGVPVLYFTASSYTGTVRWLEGEVYKEGLGAFSAGLAYKAEVALNAGVGYTFNGVPAAPEAGSFTHSKSKALIHGTGLGGSLGPVTVSFETIPPDQGKLYVTDYDLQHYVPVPAADAKAVVTVDRPDLRIEAAWTGTNAVQGGFTFAEGAGYSAVITATTKGSWWFNANHEFSYPAGTVTSQGGDDRNVTARTLQVVYKSTAAPLPNPGQVNLAGYIPAPATGEDVTRSFGAQGFTGLAAWEYEDGGDWKEFKGSVFQPAADYRAALILYAAPGYTLTGSGFTYEAPGVVSFNSSGAANTGSSVTGLQVTFSTTGRQRISDLDFTSRLPRPARNATVPAAGIVSNQYEAGEVTWDPDDGVFKPKQVYTACVTLSPKPGWTFDGLSAADFIHQNGGTAGIDPASPAGDMGVTVTITFPETADDAAVSDLDLAAKVPAPVTNASPVTYFSTPQYTGTVEWKRTGDSAALTGVFAAGTAYTATVNLVAAPGWTFEAGTGFTHGGGGSSVDNTGVTGGGSVTVTINFAQTPARYTLTFERQGGSAVTPPVTADEGTEVPKPADPSRSGYPFQGWWSSSEASGGELYAWPHALNADVTMYARWQLASVADLEIFLAAAAGGTTADAPIPVKMLVSLADGTNGWAAILAAIAEQEKYVDLDVSACTWGTEFDPGTGNTGKQYITSLVLPKTASSIKAGGSGNPTFQFFTNLKTLSAAGAASIGDYAFSGCTSLTSADLSGATSIGDYAFAYTGGTALGITLGATAPTVGSNMFDGVAEGKTVTVKAPSGASGSYDATWQDSFKDGNDINLVIEAL